MSREVVATYDKVQEGEECQGSGQRSCMLAATFQKKMLKNITTDNESVFAKHQEITKKLGDVVYFADAYASW